MVTALARTVAAVQPQPIDPHPTLFITTAMPKSGSNWLEAMVFSLHGVRGFSNKSGSCGFLTWSAISRTEGLLELLYRAGMKPGDALARLLEPDLATGSALPGELRREAEAFLARLRMRLPLRTGLLQSEAADRPALSRLVEPMFRAPGSHKLNQEVRSVGCPAKHEPAANLAELFPGWKIVQLIRDPRDVLVSRFYHDLAHMDPVMSQLFIRGSGAAISMRSDWMDAYFVRKLEELLTYYERYQTTIDESTVALVVRYETLLERPSQELTRVARFIGLDPLESEIDAACERFAFDRVAAKDAAQLDSERGERRNSFLRKGKAGDWRSYFDRRLVQSLGARFNELLVRLDYEPDDRWVQRLPTSASQAWDFSRLRARPSLARSFRRLWDDDSSLQERFPDPTDVLVPGGSFVDAIVASGDPAVLAHRATLIAMARLWNADVKETVQF